MQWPIRCTVSLLLIILQLGRQAVLLLPISQCCAVHLLDCTMLFLLLLLLCVAQLYKLLWPIDTLPCTKRLVFCIGKDGQLWFHFLPLIYYIIIIVLYYYYTTTPPRHRQQQQRQRAQSYLFHSYSRGFGTCLPLRVAIPSTRNK